MKKIALSLALLCFILASCKDDKKKDSEENVEVEVVEEVKQDEIKRITMTLESKSGSTAGGTIEFIEDSGVVKMMATLSGLTPGTHAIHIHEKADCTAEDGTSSGGHWNPTFAPHGKWGDKAGFHKGDIGNVEADEEGNASITMKTDEWCIGCGDEKKDILGKAIIVHQGTDDFTTQPTGAAGARVSCGGIIE
ncbi:superoxide dismutase family protein [Aureitalea sp. L0-47]|uniref:superoxide dismutase family protein n=1 Tax=Aureitalea sp. L0-47 TaxID=2816962 RepID=UPI0022373324|nr:superoxide dismutase family protein [Aureitalea sp. L0-47]MCW5519760.1 superoxide dismutase family protein [Aureitalea sp. L0-47]